MFDETTRDIFLLISLIIGLLSYLRIGAWRKEKRKEKTMNLEKTRTTIAVSNKGSGIQPTTPHISPSLAQLDWPTRSREITPISRASSHYGSSVDDFLQRARKLICPHCGNSNPESLQYCLHCGTSLSSESHQRISRAQRTYTCPQCGALVSRYSRYCPKCGYFSSTGARFGSAIR